MSDDTVRLKRDDLAVMTQVIKDAEELGVKAETAVVKLRFRLDEAASILDELRKQLV